MGAHRDALHEVFPIHHAINWIQLALVRTGLVSSTFVSAETYTAVPGGGRRPIISKLSSTARVSTRENRSGNTSRATMAVAVAAASPPKSSPFCVVVATNGQSSPPVQP